MKDIFDAIKDRRSYYMIGKSSPISDAEIEALFNDVVNFTPSPNNMQSQRAVLLLGEHHDKLWGDIVMETLRKRVPQEKFGPTEEKVNGFKSGYGTILYFNDETVTQEFRERIPRYAENFTTWAEHSNAMLQINFWNLLEARGFGVNIQHYNPIIDEQVRDEWGIPADWRLIAQMPFGKPTGEPMAGKKFVPIEDRVKVFK